ncbi:MAG: LPS export ABC transporter periplasmic protein LptC, partial [Ginsengibacter sp.]
MVYNNFHKILVNAAIFLGCFFISACENSLEDIQQITSKRIGVEEAKEVDIVYSLGPKTKARLTAPFMLRHQDSIPYIEFTKTVHTDFFNDSLSVESKLDAHYGRYMESESKVYLRDSVVVFNVTGDTLFC